MVFRGYLSRISPVFYAFIQKPEPNFVYNHNYKTNIFFFVNFNKKNIEMAKLL